MTLEVPVTIHLSSTASSLFSYLRRLSSSIAGGMENVVDDSIFNRLENDRDLYLFMNSGFIYFSRGNNIVMIMEPNPTKISRNEIFDV